MEDFVGRWVGGNDWRRLTVVEIGIVDGQLAVRADRGGERADIHGLSFRDDEVRFTASWPSGRTTLYSVRRSGERLAIHATYSESDHLDRDLNPDGTPKRSSGILHIAPGDSAAGSLRQAVGLSDRTDQVLAFRDDLSCGPIDPDEPGARTRWWNSMYDNWDIDLGTFWRQVMSTPDRLVVWVGRDSAKEHAFFLALVDRLGDRPFKVIDVTGLEMPGTQPDEESGPSRRMKSVSTMNPEDLAAQFGTERAMTALERDEAAQRWRRLKAENAPFRMVTESGLVSAPADVYDNDLLAHAGKDWRSVARVVSATMAHHWDSYMQVGDLMLMVRMEALVEQGRLVAQGEPWGMRSKVRLAD